MRIVIIGAGIGGLSAGIALKQLGHQVHIYEKYAGFKPIGAGLTVWRNALLGLHELGIPDAALQNNNVRSLASLRNWDGAFLSNPNRLDLPRPIEDLVRVFHRAELQQTLIDAFGPEDIVLDTAFASFTQTADSVTLTFSNGKSVACDLLIGADGIHSKVRQQLHPTSQPVYAGYTAWRAVIPYDQAKCVSGETWGANQRFGMFPVSTDQMYWYATEVAPVGITSANGEKAYLQQIFADWHAPIADLLMQTPEESILRNDVYDIDPLQKWGAGRVTLLGDAGHAMTPNLGQGACQAIESAVVLRNCLREAPNVDEALRIYETKRIRRTTPMIKQCRQIGDIGQISNKVGIFARNTLMKAIPPRLQQAQMLRSLEVDF